ncbi:putative zinc metallopeptidase [Aspergillus homomorphus CBS 101889]|uniref:Putative zinc metallopeptidase n=1 Tax=Aspergillus homomorphus (strain CBS 101889) TaxID=1450537 RepID=A0A395HIV8_ASPHC|nr:putative zinc metallopeptidase [Aspergillus homomorphus CBS 101889]RAL06838.1 putative zinc metallopeptidase [Aspergillus homomorphus CBS 101889]
MILLESETYRTLPALSYSAIGLIAGSHGLPTFNAVVLATSSLFSLHINTIGFPTAIMQILAPSDTMKDIIEKYRPDLKPFEETYRHLHQSPELSGQEKETAAIAADHLQSLGFEVHTHIGGHGVAGVLRNGEGPTVLLRADMDALPVQEKTGLPYASTKTTKNADGVTMPVMHACGHDTHVASLMASALLLHSARAHWAGTLICIFQPAEEQLDGARAMLEDGLYDKIPKPDVVLAQHVMRMKTGTVSVRAGRFLTAADAFDVRIFGRGGHGSAPHTCIDPIVAGAAVVTKLQSIVSREVTPGEMAVVTCGSFQAGHAHNIIPDYCDLKLNVRTYDAATRKRIVASIHRIVEAECEAAGCVEKPVVKRTYSTPATINDGKLVKALKGTFADYFADGLVESEPAAASEDFSLLATAVGAPYVMWTFGGVDPDTWDDAVARDVVRELPNNHSPFFAPVIQPTLRTAVDAMAVGAMTFLNKKE